MPPAVFSSDSEILIKGKNVFVGYYKNQELYKKVVKDGWFSTGDLVSFKNGRYIYKDRSKDLIIKGGINIVVSSWTMESLEDVALDLQNMIRLKGGKSTKI